jgi:hypothetical protein
MLWGVPGVTPGLPDFALATGGVHGSSNPEGSHAALAGASLLFGSCIVVNPEVGQFPITVENR